MRTQKVLYTKGLLLLAILAIATAMISTLSVGFALAASVSEIDRNATQALSMLYATTPGARALADKSKAILIFPSIVKGGFIVAGQFGEGALRKRGMTVGYYRSIAASYGFQAGAQSFGYVLFFMDEASLAYLNKSGGLGTRNWAESHSGGQGIRQEFVNDHNAEGGLCFYLQPERPMGGIGLQGSKITKINPGR